MKKSLFCIFTFILILASSCSIQKNIPQEQYLLDKVDIKADNKKVDIAELEAFLRQEPNSSFPLLGKVRLRLYNMAGQDTSKWMTRFIRKIGEPPVIYNRGLTGTSITQIQRELINKGYLNAKVDTILEVKDKKMKVTYNVKADKPYTIRTYDFGKNPNHPHMDKILFYYKRLSGIHPGDMFDQDNLEEEKVNIANFFRNVGYYSFSKEYVYFKADTTVGNRQVDLFLSFYPENKDSTVFHKFNIRNTTVLSGVRKWNQELQTKLDTTTYRGLTIVRGPSNFLRNSTIYRNTHLRPGKRYSDYYYTNTYSAFSGMGTVRQTQILFTPVATPDSVKLVDALIEVKPANPHWFQLGIDGTNTAGDLGIAPHASYQHQNLFNGGEVFSVKLKGAYEFITGSNSSDILNQNFYEYGIESAISFPQFLFPWLKSDWRNLPSASTQFSVGLNNQHRPEYTRQFFNTTITYRWTTKRNRLRHSLDLIDVNYIRMPSISAKFDSIISNPDNALYRTMYQNQLISRIGYTGVYVNSSSGRVKRDNYTLRFGADWGGLLPRLATSFDSPSRNSDGQKQILGIAYAEYIKGDISFAHTRMLNKTGSVAYRIALGVAYPFGNSNVMPFERRYFGGGSNSVRGWSTRRLGPGSYKPGATNDFVNQTGDIKLDLNLEYRSKATDYIELAAFLDAGNIWTIKKYDEQPGGEFSFSKFYKELAFSYGVGLRFDLGFLLLRLDVGMKAYDPARDEGDRWVIYRPKVSRDIAWHFAIGYPF
ncbi:outer membrane protein assembly factor BamA [Dysgonomonas sp. PH5-45]|uniref:translocation and assembly module lipoprotein TamL n=1 Tax=unclassified Dysgonomonas TaxID=2630389 RepID=UPI002475F27C|nr:MULTISPECIES: BamA/TamA family outer membrane protein [unclassified Dysgonomonas]MDH6353740.1 outer membrane protein assembly factor BamA [Dysgonomonas sp. PH5-45]MDH6386643.1 outer membrane protein assembly factor BamA [Dysgonomonas sp. PH5-37]